MVLLNGIISFEADKDPLETNDANWEERVRFKSTLAFLKLMDNYIEKMTASVFNPEDFTHEKFSVSAEWIFRRYKTYKETPVKQRLRKIAEDIHERFDTNKKLEDRIPSASVILKALNKMLKAKNTLALYEQFYTEVGESA